MSTDELSQWLRSALPALMSSGSTALNDAQVLSEYVLAQSRQAASSQQLQHLLQTQAGLAASPQLTQFAADLFARTAATKQKRSAAPPAVASSVSSSVPKVAVSSRVVPLAGNYDLVESDDDDQALEAVEAELRAAQMRMEQQKAKQVAKEERRAARKRKHTEEESRIESKSASQRSPLADSAQQHNKSASDESMPATMTDADKAELSRLSDAKERDEFVKRMLAREHKDTKQKSGDSQQPLDEVSIRRKIASEMSSAEVDALMPLLRKKARHDYLTKREAQQLELLRHSVADELHLFAESELTQLERQRLAQKQQLLRLAEGKKGIEQQLASIGGYQIPNATGGSNSSSAATKQEGQQSLAKRLELLTKRYSEAEHDRGIKSDSVSAQSLSTSGKMHKSEQQQWEAEQKSKAQLSFGARAGQEQQPQYDLVFESQIDFVKSELLETEKRKESSKYVNKQTSNGHNSSSSSSNNGKSANHHSRRDSRSQSPMPKLEPESATAKPLSPFEQIQASRKLLPIYPYRQELIDAIRQYQTLIIVGETGSVANILIRLRLFLLACSSAFECVTNELTCRAFVFV